MLPLIRSVSGGSSAVDDLPAIDVDRLAGDEAGGVIPGEKNIGFSQFHRLPGAVERAAFAELLKAFAGEGGGDERCPDGARGDLIDPDFRMRGMLPSRWVERNPVTYLMGRQAVSKGVTGNGGV